VTDWNAVHADFPINRRLIWLNNCGVAAMPGPVLAAMERYLHTLAEGGVLAVEPVAPLHDRIRGRLAALIGAAPDEVTLVHNTAEGLTFISQGLDLAAGDRIVLLQNEYPSNVYPWQHWADKGVELVFAPLGRSPEQFLEGLRPLLHERTRVVALSAVHWCTGMPLPLVEVGALCAERGILLVADGAQGVGMVPLDVRAAGIGAMAFSAWKWLLGPSGLGALYVQRDLLGRLRFPWKGPASVIDDEVYLPYRDTLKPGADRYVLSTANFNDWVYFDASLAYLEGLGFATVRARIAALTAYLGQGMQALGFELASDAFPGSPTGILSARHGRLEAEAIVTALGTAGIVGAERLQRLRLAPHVYLLEPQLDRVLAVLAELRR
jgi:cysteine desulfurase / selenocysteine lyase